jgi:ABC-2 type transport system permease protein/sodium transport system permease protein
VRPGRRLGGGHLGRLALKELRETLRDRRTIVTLVLMPVLVYPLLSIAFQKLVLTSFPLGGGPGEEKYLVAVDNVTDGQVLRDRLEASLRNAPPRPGSPPGQGPASEANRVGVHFFSDIEHRLARREVDIAVRRRERSPADPAGTEVWELLYRDDALSREALEHVERRLQTGWSVRLREQIRGASGVVVPPLVVERSHVQQADKGMALSLSALVPLILILMTITGAVYPAIDLTAGERERGTLEALIAAPVSRLGLLAAKYIAVLTVALLTATVNLTAMTVTVYSVGLGPHLFGAQGLTVGMALEVFGLLVLFAGFFSAVLLTVTSFARSFKEAQAYLIPLMLLAIAPGLLSLNENLKLDGALVVAPLVNMVLLGRDLFSGTANPLQATVVVLSTLLFAAAALAVAARVFGTDALLYGSQGTWSEAFRGPLEPQPAASVATALLCVAVLFPVFYNLQGLLGQFTGLTISDQLWTNGLFTAVLFGAFPLLVALWRKVRLTTGLGLRPPGLPHVIGAVLLGLSLWPGVYELAVLQQYWGIGQLDESLMRRFTELAGKIETQPLWLLLVTLAVIPAVFEELFFRGLVYHALAARAQAARAIVISAVLFGLFHLFISGGLATTRLLPTTLMGLVLGWVCYRSGSVVPGMLLHACHNAAALTVAYYVQELDVDSWGLVKQPHLPTTWLAVSAGGAVLGAAAFLLRPRRLPAPPR